MKIFQQNPNSVKDRQKYRALHLKT